MNWDRLENILRELWPEAPTGIGDTLRDKYRGEDELVSMISLTPVAEKIVRDMFVKLSQRPAARDNSRHFIRWAETQGFHFEVNERSRYVKNFSWMVPKYWAEFDEEETVNAEHDIRIQHVFWQLKWWSQQQKLFFLRNHDPAKLTYYAWVTYNATQQELEREDPYLSAKGLVAGDKRLQQVFANQNMFLDFDDLKFWEWRVKKGYRGLPKQRPERVMGTPEYYERLRREDEAMNKRIRHEDPRP